MKPHDDMSRIHKYMPRSQDLTLITLKGHLLVEELLDDIIESHCNNKSILKSIEIGFFVKLKLAAALSGRDDLSHGWSMCERLNALRNSLVHKLDHPIAKKRLDEFLDLYYNHPGVSSKGDITNDVKNAIYLLFVYILGARSSSLCEHSESNLTVDQ